MEKQNRFMEQHVANRMGLGRWFKPSKHSKPDGLALYGVVGWGIAAMAVGSAWVYSLVGDPGLGYRHGAADRISAPASMFPFPDEGTVSPPPVWHMWGAAETPAGVAPMVNHPISEKTPPGASRLEGITWAPLSGHALALIQMPGASQQVYRVGESLSTGPIIQAIEPAGLLWQDPSTGQVYRWSLPRMGGTVSPDPPFSHPVADPEDNPSLIP